MQVITRPHIFSERDARTLDLPAGGTVLDILDAAGWSLELRDYTRVFLAEREIPEDWWPRARPKEGATLRVLLVPGKGKQGKGIAAAIASLAVAIVAPYAGPAIAGALTGTTVAATSTLGIASTIAFTAVGSLAVNALFKPAPLNNSPQQVGPNSSPAYSISGQSNAATPYQPCVKVLGRHRVYPRIVGAPRTEVHGEDQYMVMALDWGYAPLNVTDIRIGDTPLANFAGVEHRMVHYPYDPMSGIASELLIYSQDVSPAGLAFTLGWKEPVTARTKPSTKIATLHFYFPQGLVAMHPDFRVPLTNVVEATIEIRNVTASGPWQAFTQAADVTISAPAGRGTTNSNGFAFWVKPNVIAADPITGLPTHYGFDAGTATFTIQSGPAPAVGDTCSLFGLTRTVTVVSGTTVTLTPALLTFHVTEEARRFPIERWDGSETWSVMEPAPIAINVNPRGTLIHVEHNVLKPFAVSARCVLPVAAEWEFRVTRTTEPKTASHFNPGSVGRIPFDPSSVFDEMMWTGIESVEWPFRPPVKPRVPRTVSELRIRASDQFNGVIAQLSGIASSVLPIPGGGWLETANPAWIVRDILCGAWNPRAIPVSKIDDADFAAFAARCDALGLRCDTVIDYGVRVDALCESILAAARGTLSRGMDGRYTIIADGAFGSRVQVFSDQNSHGMVGRRTFADVPHALRVKFIDPDSGWQERTRVVPRDGYCDPEAPAAGLAPATKFEELATFGVASGDLAWKVGRTTLADMMLRPGTYALETDIEHLACKRGSKVGVQSMTIGSGGESCHVAQVIDARNLRVDVPFGSIDPAGTYGLIVKRQFGGDSGTLACHPVGDKVWRTSLDHGAEVGDVIVWGFVDRVVTDFIVKAIKPGADWTATLELTDLGEGIMSAISGPIPPYFPPRGGRPPDAWGLTPQGLAVELIERIVDRVRVYDMRLNWESNALAHEWRIYRMLPSGVRWPLMTVSSATALAIEAFDRRTLPLSGEQVVFEVTGVSSRGAESPGARIAELALPDTTAPNPPRTLSASVNARHVSLIWSAPEDEDVVAHQLRWLPSLDSLEWTLAEIIAESVPWDTVGLVFPARVGTYMIKTRDSAGNYSVNPAVARVRELQASSNVLLSVPISLSSGTSQDCTVVAGALKADSIDRFWLRDDIAFWGGDAALFWRPTVYLDMLWTWSHEVPVDGVGTDMGLDVVHSGIGLKIEYSRDSIHWSVFPGKVIAETGVYHFRISLQGGAAQGVISSCAVTYDVPDLEEIISGLDISSGGTWLPLTVPFRQIVAVIPGLDKTAGGVAVGVAVTALTATTVQVKGIDAAGAYSGAKASFIVRGY